MSPEPPKSRSHDAGWDSGLRGPRPAEPGQEGSGDRRARPPSTALWPPAPPHCLAPARENSPSDTGAVLHHPGCTAGRTGQGEVGSTSHPLSDVSESPRSLWEGDHIALFSEAAPRLRPKASECMLRGKARVHPWVATGRGALLRVLPSELHAGSQIAL